jgi:hypothetical protein
MADATRSPVSGRESVRFGVRRQAPSMLAVALRLVATRAERRASRAERGPAKGQTAPPPRVRSRGLSSQPSARTAFLLPAAISHEVLTVPRLARSRVRLVHDRPTFPLELCACVSAKPRRRLTCVTPSKPRSRSPSLDRPQFSGRAAKQSTRYTGCGARVSLGSATSSWLRKLIASLVNLVRGPRRYAG